MNFGYTITVVFHLAPDVAQALLKLISAAIDHAASYQFGPTDAHCPTMYFYIANRCQYAIAHIFPTVPEPQPIVSVCGRHHVNPRRWRDPRVPSPHPGEK